MQGIAIDEEKGYIYFSFTTVLMKFDFDGNIIGSVHSIAGHLGCITFDKEKRKIYGSLELKHDAIGKGISKYTGEKRYFFFTGNTEYGIQNLEYDKFTNTYMLAVYPGFKSEFVNYPLFFIDAAKPAEIKKISGRNDEEGLILSSAQPHKNVTDTRDGCIFKYGQTGIYSFGDSRYAFSHGEISGNEKGEFSAEVVLYKFSEENENIFEEMGI